jgi:rare lipoprotein A
VGEAGRAAGSAILCATIAVYLAGCATSLNESAVPSNSTPAISGIASWYGPGFDGRRTSSGAVYDQEGLSAASTLFPLGTRLHVTNLATGRAIEVTVNDHGPYMKGRSLDLSHLAAQRLGMLGPGTAPVRMEVVQSPPGGPILGQRYFVQVGSFADPSNARAVELRLAPRYPDVTVLDASEGAQHHYRVRMGVFMDRRDAEGRASNLARLGYSPVVITE